MKSLIAFMVVLLMTGVACAQDQGMTSTRHRENVGKILWAKERIQFNAQDQIPLATSFQAGEPIYGRIYLPKSLVRLGNDNHCPNQASNYRIKVTINGESKGILNEQWFESPAWTTVQVTPTLTPGDGGDRQNRGVPEKWMKIVRALPDGNHNVMFELWGGPVKCEAKFAGGGFTLTKSGDVTAALGALPKAQMSNANLEQEMIQAVKSQGWTNEYPVKVVIIEPAWRIIRDVFGKIIHREINTNVILKKNADGSCRINDISFIQLYTGNNQYGGTKFYGMGLKSYSVACP